MRHEYATKPREQIAAILATERRYLSAAEIFERLERAEAGVSLSTVYRTLERLREKGVATSRLDERGEATYLACEPSHHHHAICRVCGDVEDVPCEAIERFARSLHDERGFILDGHTIEFFGRCKSCG